MADYNTMELMICTAARELEDGSSVGVGTGAPCAAAMLAQKAHSPNLVILFEAGGAAPLNLKCPYPLETPERHGRRSWQAACVKLWRRPAGECWITPSSVGRRLICTET